MDSNCRSVWLLSNCAPPSGLPAPKSGARWTTSPRKRSARPPDTSCRKCGWLTSLWALPPRPPTRFVPQGCRAACPAAPAAARCIPIAAKRADTSSTARRHRRRPAPGRAPARAARRHKSAPRRAGQCRRRRGCRPASPRREMPAAPLPTDRRVRRCVPPRGRRRPPRVDRAAPTSSRPAPARVPAQTTSTSAHAEIPHETRPFRLRRSHPADPAPAPAASRPAVPTNSPSVPARRRRPAAASPRPPAHPWRSARRPPTPRRSRGPAAAAARSR